MSSYSGTRHSEYSYTLTITTADSPTRAANRWIVADLYSDNCA